MSSAETDKNTGFNVAALVFIKLMLESNPNRGEIISKGERVIGQLLAQPHYLKNPEQAKALRAALDEITAEHRPH